MKTPNWKLEANEPGVVYFPALEEVFFEPEAVELELPPYAARQRALLLEASESEIQAALVEALGMMLQAPAQQRRYLAHLSLQPAEEPGG